MRNKYLALIVVLAFITSGCTSDSEETVKVASRSKTVTVYCNGEFLLSAPKGLVYISGDKITVYTDLDEVLIKQRYIMKPGDNCSSEVSE